MKKYLAIDNVCAWPNIKKLSNDEVVAIIFNQPCHLLWEGTIECWVSANHGRGWELRSPVVVNEPTTSRGNVAVGLNAQGHLVVLCGGWDQAAPAPEKFCQGNINDDRIKYKMKERSPLPIVVSVSEDNGHTWKSQDIKIEGTDHSTWVPFGEIIILEDGSLGCSMYSCGEKNADRTTCAYFFKSVDNGKAWQSVSCIKEKGNETEIVKLPNGKILAAVRSRVLDLYESIDDGISWKYVNQLTMTGMFPAGFTLLNDDHLLLTYGIRHRGLYGIGAMTMDLESETWGSPMLIADFDDAWDGGYPSNVQLDNGEIVTAYYCSPNTNHNRYHMGVVIWDWVEFAKIRNACPQKHN